MTPEEFYEKMSNFRQQLNGVYLYDNEDFHIDADDLMCELLTSLGYGDGIKVFQDTPKWYS